VHASSSGRRHAVTPFAVARHGSHRAVARIVSRAAGKRASWRAGELEDAPYYGAYGTYWNGGGPTRDEARGLARDQAHEERRLDQRQEQRRQQLLDKQAERRERRQADDTWRKKNASWQRQQRQQQRERFQQERGDLKKKHDREWDRANQ